MELECQNCGALIDVDGLEKYSVVDCWSCGEEMEIVDNELIRIEN